MDKNQADIAANVLIENERSKRPPRKPQEAVPARSRMARAGVVIGFSLGMLIGRFFFDDALTFSLIGLALGALAGYGFGMYSIRPRPNE